MSLKFYLPRSPDAIQTIQSFQKTSPVNITGIAESLGLNVWEDDLPVGASGKLFRDADNGGGSGFSIIVNEQEPLVRKRFTVAHEIAHYLLHLPQVGLGIQDDTFYRSVLSDGLEREANKFAAEILMPASLIQGAISAGHKDMSEIARDLQVSEVALKIHLGMPT